MGGISKCTKMKQIHPLIQGLNVSYKAKLYFNICQFHEIIEDKIVLSTKEYQADEAQENCWSFKIDLEYCTPADVEEFYRALISARIQSMKKQYIQEDLIFYSWYDSASGNFYFSLIPHTLGKLPFGCAIRQVASIKAIIQEVIEDKYRGSIPIDEFIEVPNNELVEQKSHFILNVWSTILRHNPDAS
jgi:hypothetical protein